MALEDEAEVMSNTALAEQITGQPAEVEAAVLEINDEARNRSLQVALLVPLLPALLGLGNSFRMLRLPACQAHSQLEGMDFGWRSGRAPLGPARVAATCARGAARAATSSTVRTRRSSTARPRARSPSETVGRTRSLIGMCARAARPARGC